MGRIASVLIAVAFVTTAAHGQTFPSDVVLHFGGKMPPVRVSSCDEWKAKLATKPTNSSWVYNYRMDVPEKSEYETTEHYRQRTALKPAYASIALDDPFYSAKYDADAGTLTIDAGNGGVVFNHRTNSGSYIGSNAFGGSRLVAKSKEVTLMATLAENNLFQPAHLVLNVSPARARAIKEHGHLRILGRIVSSDWVKLLNFTTEPTIEEPEERTMATRDVTISPLCAAVEVAGQVSDWSDLK